MNGVVVIVVRIEIPQGGGDGALLHFWRAEVGLPDRASQQIALPARGIALIHSVLSES